MNLTLTTPQEMNLAQKCASCGSLAEKLYQHNVCKGCLQQSFEKMIPLINKFRESWDKNKYYVISETP